MESLPQLETSSFAGQIFWLFVTFSVLYFFISKSFLPKIWNILFEREKYLKSIDEKISLFLEKTNKTKATNKNILENSKNQVSEILKNLKNQKTELKTKSNQNIELEIKKLNDNFQIDSKKNFELNKEKIYNSYLQINKLLSNKFFDSTQESSLDLDENQTKLNFEKNFLLKNQNF